MVPDSHPLNESNEWGVYTMGTRTTPGSEALILNAHQSSPGLMHSIIQGL